MSEPLLRISGLTKRFRRGGTIVDAVAGGLSIGADEPIELPGLPTAGGDAVLSMQPIAERSYRLRPWPLQGRRLVVHADARLLPSRSYASGDELRAAWDAAPTRRLSWTLLSTGESAD